MSVTTDQAAIGSDASIDTQAVVARAWTEVLRGRGLTEDLPFDVAGGDSLRLLRLVLRFEEQCSVQLPLEAFALHMRPSEFAAALCRVLSGQPDMATEHPTMLMVRARCGDDPGEAGLRAACAEVAHIVPIGLPDWPELASRNGGIDGLVDHVVAEIEAQAPPGPILLLGYCFGGMLAFAAARRLAASGRRIGFLGILDADAGWLLEARRRPMQLERWPRRAWWAWHRGHLTDHVAMLAAWWLIASPRLLRWLGRRDWQRRLPENFALHLNRHLQILAPAWLNGDDKARLLQADRPLDAPVFVFRSQEHTEDAAPDLNWASRCTELTMVPVPGLHDQIFQPEYLPALTTAFTRVLTQTLAGARA